MSVVGGGHSKTEGDDVSDAEVRNLKAGDELVEVFNGVTRRRTVVRVKSRGACSNPRSGAFGNAWAIVELLAVGTDLQFTVGIHSDEYAAGEGYPSHRNGQRVRGWELSFEQAVAA